MLPSVVTQYGPRSEIILPLWSVVMAWSLVRVNLRDDFNCKSQFVDKCQARPEFAA